MAIRARREPMPIAKCPGFGTKGPAKAVPGPLLARNTEPPLAETVAEILEAYRSGAARPEDIVARSYARIRAHDDPAIFISLRDEAELLAEARALQQAGKTSLPLYGIPVAAKDKHRRERPADDGGLPGL
jgi:hypothetical protein